MIGVEARLTACARAMREVIIPGLDRDQAQANDQARIVLGTLEMLIEQCPRMFDLALTELRQYTSFAQALLELQRPLADCVPAGDCSPGPARRLSELAALNEPPADAELPSYPAIRERVLKLRRAVDAVVEECLEEGLQTRRDVVELVMAHAEVEVLRERAWNRGAGFDDAELPPIDQLLSPGAW